LSSSLNLEGTEGELRPTTRECVMNLIDRQTDRQTDDRRIYTGAVLRCGRGAIAPPNVSLAPKSLVTAAVCSSKTSKQLYRGRFLEGWSG